MATIRFPRMRLWRDTDKIIAECESWILGYARQLEDSHAQYHVHSRAAERRVIELESRIATLQDISGDLLRVRDKFSEFL